MDSAPLLLPNTFEPPAFCVELKMLAGCAVEVIAGDSCGLLFPSAKPLKPAEVVAGDSCALLDPSEKPLNLPDDAAADVVDCCVEGDFPKLANAFAPSWGALPNSTELLLAPELVVGGSPAGVVEFPNMFELGLLVGVVLAAWPVAIVFELAFPKLKLPPVLAAPPNKPGVWPCAIAGCSEGLFGVEKRFAEGGVLVDG